MKSCSKISIKFFVALIFLSLTACGSVDSSGEGSISYTGATNQAAIDSANAQEISVSSYQNGSPALTIGGLSVVSEDDVLQARRPRALILAKIFEDAINQVDMRSPYNVASKNIEIRNIIPSKCLGSTGRFTYTMYLDDISGFFDGSFDFLDYCSKGVIISGYATFTGTKNIYTLITEQLFINFNSLTVVSGGDSFTAEGDLTLIFSSITMNMLMKDNNTSEVFMIDDLNMNVTEETSYVYVDIVSGSFYHPVYGYVTLVTSTPFEISNTASWPYTGELLSTGTGGTKAKLEAVSSTQYRVTADTDDDGVFDDYDSGLQKWADI